MSERDEIAFALRGVRHEREGRPVLLDIDLDLPAGRTSALIGPSGGGKTSLLRLLNRLDDPAAGTIRFRGRPVTDLPVGELRRRVGFVFQRPVMFPGTVADNLRTAAELGGAAEPDLDRDRNEALARAELPESIADRPAEELSVGQQQRVTIARALMTAPDVLLLDEPTAALDVETARRLNATLRRLTRTTGLTVIFATHRLAEARTTSDYVVLLDAGRVVEAGATDRVFGRPRTARARSFLGGDHTDSA